MIFDITTYKWYLLAIILAFLFFTNSKTIENLVFHDRPMLSTDWSWINGELVYLPGGTTRNMSRDIRGDVPIGGPGMVSPWNNPGSFPIYNRPMNIGS